MSSLNLLRTRPLLLVVTAAGFATAVAIFLTAQGGSSEVLKGITAEDLALQGITLEEPPQGATTVVTADLATQLARAKRGGATVREVRLVRLIDKHPTPTTDKVAWAVDFDPATVNNQPLGPFVPGASPSSAVATYVNEYSVSFVDPQSGEVFFSITASHTN
ncbi:MAG: hypothetical protein E6J42_12870 [Chloroflexi bacterium]|nr:MAG: hypothetical protein E6J42_12870 [Chloroflexota bacterium]